MEAQRLREEPFSPECLTLYMNNECNLDCVYCHTDPSREPAARLEMEVIGAAAEVVAEWVANPEIKEILDGDLTQSGPGIGTTSDGRTYILHMFCLWSE